MYDSLVRLQCVCERLRLCVRVCVCMRSCVCMCVCVLVLLYPAVDFGMCTSLTIRNLYLMLHFLKYIPNVCYFTFFLIIYPQFFNFRLIMNVPLPRITEN